MNERIFKQNDPEYAGLPYPTYSSNFGDNGCGCCACVHTAIEQESKKDWDIEDLRGWMIDQGFAVPGHGTEWEGIVATLEHIGHKNVVWVKTKDPIEMAWEELDKGNRIGVLLVDNGSTPDGTYWTSSGHYISFNKYWKDSEGRHWFNVKDSGTRGHDGEFCYERSMRGALPQLYIVERIGAEPEPAPDDGHYHGAYPVVQKYLEPGDKGTQVTRLQKYLDWYFDGQFFKECGPADGVYGSNTLKWVNKMLADFFGASEADGKVGPKTIARMKEYKKGDKPTPPPEDGHYHGEYPVVKLYLEPGDKGIQVSRLQKYLDWYFDGEFFKNCGPADGVYGQNTLKYTNRMLTDFFGPEEADGKVGNKTIARMKTYSKNDPKPTPTPSHKGEVLDVSDFQDDIDWTKAKKDGVAGVIVRCGLRGGEKGDLRADSMFLKHIKGAYAAGLKVGVYMFTTAINAKEGREEAVYAINQIQKAGLPLSYPVAVDTENVFWKEKGERVAGRSNSTKLSKAKRTEAIKAFCEEMKAQGYEPMIYASLSWFKDCLDMSKLPYKVWCAQYNSSCQYEGEKALWQYTSTGRVSGYNDVVDMNKNYLPDNYDPRIKPEPTPTPTPTPGGKYTGPLPTEADIRTASRNGVIDGTIAWARKIDKDDFAYLWPQAPGCYFCGTVKRKAYTCMPLITAAYAHGGEDPDVLSICKRKHAFSLHEDDRDWQTLIRKGKFKFLGRMSKLSWADIQPGDILVQYASDDNHGHMMEYIGGNQLFEAIPQGCKITDGAKSRFTRYKNGESQCGQGSLNFVMRYVGSRTYLKKGDRGAAVTMLQDYLNWYFDGEFYKECGPADGVFGANTHKWVVKMQTDFFGAAEADGTVGPRTIARMAEVVK